MNTFFKYKINTAIIISLAFIFRLLFVNIGILPEFQTSQTNKLLNSHFSTVQKKRRQAQASVQYNIKDYGSIEVCDEDLDGEEDLIKANLPVILSNFFSFFNPGSLIQKSIVSFDLIKCTLYPKKYLALSILRI